MTTAKWHWPTRKNGENRMSTYGMSTCGSPLFASIQTPQAKTRWESFAVSYSVQAVGLAALLVFTIVAPKITPPLISNVELVAPDLTPAPKSLPVKPVVRPLVRIHPLIAAPPAPTIARIQPPVHPVQRPQRMQAIAPVAEIAQPRPVVPAPKFDSKLLAAIPGPKVAPKIVATNTFGGSSATPTLPKVAASKVQTGGFGDPNGVPVNAHGSNHANIAAAGSFDLPAGGGSGNGTGGTSGVRGTVASAGFGNGVAIQGGGGRGGNAAQGRLQTTNFGSAAAPATGADPVHQAKAVNQSPISAPVSIQSKPTPVYTPEARQLNVEGEVLLNVVFTANGQIRILNVVRGLGHGLDEAAQRAAQGIRFSPAMRDGHPVDSNATLHIVFQLS
jgi:TonB family protein